MRAKSWVVMLGLVLVLLTAAPARAGWSGPGWYIRLEGDVANGPFRSQGDCLHAIDQDRSVDADLAEEESCSYVQQAPARENGLGDLLDSLP